MPDKDKLPSTPTIEISGTVQKIIPASETTQEMAQIFIHCSDGSFAEIRITNSLQTKDGKSVALIRGAHVEITVKADRRTKAAHA
jgi:NADPH:quinone reductase-like Zn-dependent oxidoreductase